MEEEKVSPKDAYERAWECRDFEISHLWERSVFLGAFLLGIAGAYGAIIMSMYFSAEVKVTYQQHFIACGVCWLGLAFSILWVMMAKGSKYWFEKYEAGIDSYEDGDFGKEIQGYSHHGTMPKLSKKQYNENIFSPKAGHYSVSKVNGTIGIIALTTWSLLEMFHFVKFLDFHFEHFNSFQCVLLSFASYLGFGAILFVILRFLCKSGEKDE